jgi:DNA-binding transcriptional ArsR family regulator
LGSKRLLLEEHHRINYPAQPNPVSDTVSDILLLNISFLNRNNPFRKNHGLKTKSLLTILKYIGIRCRDVSDSEEETYSTMFTSLKHPARRKILRMLGEKPKSFSMILEELGISSSHLTYHLENLGELVTKMDDGRYKLSTFGRAAVLTMAGVEETPEVKPKHALSLPTRWQPIVAAMLIGIIILAGVAYIQNNSLNQISEAQGRLESEVARLSTENDRLLSWNMHTDRAESFLRDVIQLDLTKYYVALVSNTLESRSDLGGITEEILKYSLTSNESSLDVSLRFRNQTLSLYRMNIIEGSPIYSQPQPTNVLHSTYDLITRYQTFTGASYLGEMRSILETVNQITDEETTVGNMKLQMSSEGADTEIRWLYTIDGIDFPTKGILLSFGGNTLEEFTDGYYLYRIGNTKLNISEEEAIAIAREHAKTVSWTADGEVVKNFVVLQEPVETTLWPHPREPLELVPYWYVTLHLDKVYPGNVDSIGFGIWADTGVVSGIKTISTG